jgi:hypothetical protein
MQKDTLEYLLKTIEDDCCASNIQIFYGRIEESEYTPVSCVEDQKGEWPGFHKLLKALDAKVITVYVEKNDRSDYDEINRSIEGYPKELQGEYLSAIKVVKKNQGKIASISVSFYCGFLNYQFTKDAEWYDDFLLLCGMPDYDDGVGDDEVENSETEYSELQVEELARTLAGRPAIAKAANEREIKNILWAMPETDKIKSWSSRKQVIARAQEIFIQEIHPKQEAEMNKRVHEKKKQGFKKTQVKGMLNISENTINRHWYQEFEGA